MDTTQTPASPARSVRAEAAAWLAKLHGPERSVELEEEFRSWINAHPANARAFEHVTEVWDTITPEATAGLPRVVAEYNGRGPESRFLRSGTKRRVRVAATAASVACAALALWIVHGASPGERYITDVGEQRTVVLADGSRLTLNSNSRVRVVLGKADRRVVMDRGEAYLEVAKDARRPFMVIAGSETITALGTTFLVRYEKGGTAVTLLEGSVIVAPVDPRQGSPAVSQKEVPEPGTVVLSPGERATYAAAGTVTVDKPKPQTTAAWRRGEVVLDETPLESAVSEMNRYEHRQIVIDDPRIGSLPISGVYRTGDGAGFALAIATAYDLQITRSGEEIHLHRP